MLYNHIAKMHQQKKYFIRIHDEIFVIRWNQLTYVLVISIGDPLVAFVVVLAAIGGPLGLTIVGGIAGLINLSDVRLLDDVTMWPYVNIVKYLFQINDLFLNIIILYYLILILNLILILLNLSKM